jgi:hypothetical protein
VLTMGTKMGMNPVSWILYRVSRISVNLSL